MRTTLWMVGVMALGLTGTAHAQERAMVTTSVGIATTSEATSGAIDLGSGVSLNRRLTVFGGIGRVMNVAPALAQPAVNAAGMTRVGGGVQIPIHKQLSATVDYNWTRIGTSQPVNIGALNVGIGLRF